jgi:hypothetical protein
MGSAAQCANDFAVTAPSARFSGMEPYHILYADTDGRGAWHRSRLRLRTKNPSRRPPHRYHNARRPRTAILGMVRMFDLATIAEGFGLLRTAIGAVKDTKELLPKHQQTVVDQTLMRASLAAAAAEAQLAQGLGYQLCQCTWPPQIMRRTSTGEVLSHAQQVRWEEWRCLICGQTVRVPVKKIPR